MDFTPLKTSELIRKLQHLIEKHGDLPVCFDDRDTGWLLPIELEGGAVDDRHEEVGPLILISASYHYLEKK